MAASVLKRFALGAITVGAMMLAAPAFAEITDDNLSDKVAAATTSADHLEIAAYYRALADDSAKRIKSHERMRAQLGAVGKPSTSWNAHCNGLIAVYKNAEKEAIGMAQEHEALAKKSGK